jgi:serine/threonine protein kinase
MNRGSMISHRHLKSLQNQRFRYCERISIKVEFDWESSSMNNCPNCGDPYEMGDEVCRTCGFILPFTTATITAGEILQSRYEIQELIHSGGMGYVYLATDKRLYDRFCIVKQVKEPIKSDAHRKKLEEEALRMAKLNHPNVAMILDHFIDGGYYFLVVERIYGKTLSEVFKERRGHLEENEVVRWAISICDVVSYLHSEGIVHRDISPDNIMLTGEGSIKFIDFGTLREFRYIVPGGTVGIGKYGYTPPEQWQSKPEFRSDIFAMGATIYYLLTGFLPLSREYLARQMPQKEDFNPSFPPIRTKNPSVSPQLETVLQKALQLDIGGRYASAVEFGEALRNLERVEIKKVPALRVEPERLDFANVKSGATVTKPLILRNTGTGKLSGKLTTSQPWLKVSPSRIDLKRGEWKGKVTVDTLHLAPGFYGAGEISITTNSGRARVDVDLSIATEARPKRISKPKAGITLRWAVISLGIILFLIVSAGVIYFASGHPFTLSPTLAIQDVSVSDVTEVSAVITWTTDKPATSQVEYGSTTDYGLATTLDGELVTSHRVELTGLQPNAACYFRVMSKDASGHEATSDTQQLTTLQPDTKPPVISKVKVAKYTGETATITWETDEDAIGQVEYGTTDAYGELGTLDADLATNHGVGLTGLQPNTTYHFRIKARDGKGNEAWSDDYTFTTWFVEKGWTEYINGEYGFSVNYPKNWEENKDEEKAPTVFYAADPAQVPTIRVAVVEADIFADAVTFALEEGGASDIKVGAEKEATLADGTKGTTAKVDLKSHGYYAESYALGVKKGDKWVTVVVSTVALATPYDEDKFSQIARTLRFTAKE